MDSIHSVCDPRVLQLLSADMSKHHINLLSDNLYRYLSNYLSRRPLTQKEYRQEHTEGNLEMKQDMDWATSFWNF